MGGFQKDTNLSVSLAIAQRERYQNI